MDKNRKFYRCKDCGKKFEELSEDKKCKICGGNMQAIHIIHADNTPETEIKRDIK